MRKEKTFGYKLGRFILGPIYKLLYNPKLIGKANIPKNGAIILCGNHHHAYDQFPVLIATKRVIHYMAKKEYFEGKAAWFFKFTGCIPVNRQIHDTDAKERAINILKEGGAVGIFPEGTRNRTEEILLPFKFGAVSMAKKTDAWLVPFGHIGDQKILKNNLTFVFGEPFKVGDMSLEEANKKLTEKVKELILIAKEQQK